MWIYVVLSSTCSYRRENRLGKNRLSRWTNTRRFVRRKICLSRLHIRRFVRPLCASGQSLESPRGCLTRSSNLLITCGLFAPKFFWRSGLLNCIFEITIAFKGGIKQAASPNFFHLSPSCVLFHGNLTEPAQAFRGKTWRWRVLVCLIARWHHWTLCSDRRWKLNKTNV